MYFVVILTESLHFVKYGERTKKKKKKNVWMFTEKGKVLCPWH